jgi:hypothetical protein
MSGFDLKCPHCLHKHDEHLIYQSWASRGHNSEFEIGCEHCHLTLVVNVHSVPEFEITAKRCCRCLKAPIQTGSYCKACKPAAIAKPH